MTANIDHFSKAISLLKSLIETPSFSREEEGTATLISEFLGENGIAFQRAQNNVYAQNQYFDPGKPTILLNSHHDTVKPNSAYTIDPFSSLVKGDQIFGLGSNDAGGPLVSLIACFVHFYQREDLPYNLILAATAEEEISGPNGIESILNTLPEINFAIVGEPTGMQMAIAEKGLLVIDGIAKGQAGHAAHATKDTAIYTALEDIEWIRKYQFEKTSDVLGSTKMTVTQINAGSQHNVVPAECRFVIDVRVNEHYTNREVFDFIDINTQSELKGRSFRLNSSSIPIDHPLVEAGKALGLTTYGSPTLSDQALLPCPSVKMGPGDSSRSHQPDEYILASEIEAGLKIYIALLEKLFENHEYETLG